MLQRLAKCIPAENIIGALTFNAVIDAYDL